MLIIPITVTNLALVTALNDGVQPRFEILDNGGTMPTYLVMESGEVNRIISHKELSEMRKTMTVETTTRKFHYTK